MIDKLYVVIPAYNEEANIEKIIGQWHSIVKKVGPDSRLVIINDGSKHRTYEIMEGLSKKYRQLIPLIKPNSGHGPTCIYGYNYAINSGVDYIFKTDSDGQTNPKEFWKFWEARKRYDFVIGIRKKRQDGTSRLIVTRTLRLIVWLIFAVTVRDPNTPFRMMNANHLKTI